MKEKTESQVKQDLKKRLGQPVSDVLWDRLVKDFYVNEVIQGERDITSLANKYREFDHLALAREMERKRSTQMGRVVKKLPPDSRTFLQGKMLSSKAAEDLLVKRFRTEYLPDGLLAREDVEPWIKEQVRNEGRMITYDEDNFITSRRREDSGPGGISYSSQVEVKPPLPLSLSASSLEFRARVLNYRIPGASQSYSIRGIRKGGALANLRTVSKHLAHRYGWEEEQATVFVLTGEPVVMSPIVVTILAFDASADPGPSSNRRIVMDIDSEVAPEMVKRVYSTQRKSLRQKDRYRSLSERVAKLVSFVLDHPDDTWKERWTAWNHAYPQWKYETDASMAQIYRRAKKKLMQGNEN